MSMKHLVPFLGWNYPSALSIQAKNRRTPREDKLFVYAIAFDFRKFPIDNMLSINETRCQGK